jgi:hypothetical protein
MHPASLTSGEGTFLQDNDNVAEMPVHEVSSEICPVRCTPRKDILQPGHKTRLTNLGKLKEVGAEHATPMLELGLEGLPSSGMATLEARRVFVAT